MNIHTFCITMLCLLVGAVIAVFLPWGDWFMALRIRSAKKSLAEGRRTLSTLENAIAELRAKIAQSPQAVPASFGPLLKALDAQHKSLSSSIERFAERLKFVQALRSAVNHKNYTPQQVDDTIVKLNVSNEKMDEFLAKLNGDDENKNGNG